MDDRPEPNRTGLRDGLRESLRRLVDQRAEGRAGVDSLTAVLNHRGHRHVVRVADISVSGAMIVFEGNFAEGEEVVLQLLDHGPVKGQVRWSRDGRVGVRFADPDDVPAK